MKSIGKWSIKNHVTVNLVMVFIIVAGLAICRGIVEHHGGRIWAENNSDVGATVICEMPAYGPVHH